MNIGGAPCWWTSIASHTAVHTQCCPPWRGTPDVHEHLGHKPEHPVFPVCEHPVHLTSVMLNSWLGNLGCSNARVQNIRFLLLVNELLKVVLLQRKNELSSVSLASSVCLWAYLALISGDTFPLGCHGRSLIEPILRGVVVCNDEEEGVSYHL